MTTSNSVIERVQKLLRMADGGTKHEAEVAAAKAQRLMTEYNLDLQTVSASSSRDFTMERTEDEERSRKPMEDKHIIPLLIEHFFVKIVIHGGGGRYWVNILGTKENVEVAKYVYGFLAQEFRRLWLEYKREMNAPLGYKESIYTGMARDLDRQLRKEKFAVCDERGLMLVEDPELSNYVKSQYSHLKFERRSYQYLDEDVVADGEALGRKIKIRPGIKPDTGNGVLITD